MIDIAVKHEQALRELFFMTWHNEKYKFWLNGSWSDQYEVARNTWDKHEFVSLNSRSRVIGYIAYYIDRDARNVSGISVINFSDNKIVFGRDLFKTVSDIFTKFDFNKIEFDVVCGNPVERSYDRLVSRFGGRVVGVKKDHCRLVDGKYYDLKMYEIVNPAKTDKPNDC